MQGQKAQGTEVRERPYKTLREDPLYDELKRLIDDLPPDKIEKLKSYVRKWERES